MGSPAVAHVLIGTKMFRGLWIVALFLVAKAAVDPDQSTKENWRCGVFIPGKKFREPLAKFFVLQTLPPAVCPPLGKPDTRSMRKSCGQMGQAWEGSFLQFDRLWTPFLAKVPGNKRPVDVCQIIQLELGIDDIPGEDDKKYKDGMQLGFYYNFCGNSKWKDTGLRTKSKVCCQNGVSRNCTELLQEKKDMKDMKELPSTIESEAENQNAPNSEPKGSQEVKEDAETEKGKGKGPKNISTQEKVILPNMKTGGQSTEELLKILAEGNLSEAGVASPKVALQDLKKRAEEVAGRIKQLEEMLSIGKNLEK